MAKYAVIDWMGGYAIQHIATLVICEVFDRKCSANQRLNRHYN